MLTVEDVMTGQVPSLPIRLGNLARILGVSLWRRDELRAWLEANVPYLDGPPTTGPWTARPMAGCWDLAAVSEALRDGTPPDCAHHALGRPIPAIETICPATLEAAAAARASGP